MFSLSYIYIYIYIYIYVYIHIYRRASLLPQSLLQAARAHFRRLGTASAAGGDAGGGVGGGGGGEGTGYVLLAAQGKVTLSWDSQQQFVTAMGTLATSRHGLKNKK